MFVKQGLLVTELSLLNYQEKMVLIAVLGTESHAKGLVATVPLDVPNEAEAGAGVGACGGGEATPNHWPGSRHPHALPSAAVSWVVLHRDPGTQ